LDLRIAIMSLPPPTGEAELSGRSTADGDSFQSSMDTRLAQSFLFLVGEFIKFTLNHNTTRPDQRQ